MLPQVIFLYGAPKTGKTTVGHQLADKIGYELISLNSFYKRFNIKDHMSAVNELVSHLKFSSKSFFIVDDLIPTREEYNVFVNQLGEPYRIFYFDASKDEVERNINSYSSEAEAKYNVERFVHFIENRPTLSQSFKDKSYHIRVNAVQPIEDITKDIMGHLKPTVLAAYYTKQEEEHFIKRLASEKGWTIIDVEQLIQGHSHRNTPIGKKISGLVEAKKPLAPKHKLDSLKNSLFTSGVQKALLVHMGEHLDLYESFEHELFPIRMLNVEFEKRKDFLAEDHPLLYFFERGDLLSITKDRLDLVDAKLNRGVNYGIVFGPTSAGKTFLSKAIAKIYGFVLIEWEPTLTTIKEKYPGEEETVPFPKILRYFKDLFAANSRRTFIFDGFQPEKNLDAFIEELGAPSFLITLQVEKPILVKRTRAKEGADVNAEVGEEENQKIEAAIQKGNGYGKTCESLTEKHPTTRSFTLDANGTLDGTLHAVDEIFSKRVYVVHQTVEEANPVIQKSFNNLFKNICLAENITYVDVVQLVAKHYHHKASSMHSELRNQYKMKTSKHDKPESPSHYSPTVVLHIINEHLHHTKQDSTDLLLMGYPSPLEADQVYPRPSDQLAAVESGLGGVRVVVVIAKDEVAVEINDPVMKLEKPAEPQKEKKEGEGEPPAEDKPPEEAKKSEYSIFDYVWTETTGKSKSLGQWYCNVKPQVERVITYELFRVSSILRATKISPRSRSSVTSSRRFITIVLRTYSCSFADISDLRT